MDPINPYYLMGGICVLILVISFCNFFWGKPDE